METRQPDWITGMTNAITNDIANATNVPLKARARLSAASMPFDCT